jgi:hypothetical protein
MGLADGQQLRQLLTELVIMHRVRQRFVQQSALSPDRATLGVSRDTCENRQ